ncbi:MAG: hypothetical protein HYZ31_03640 [Gammaproteobacteria bacterium]|nr:hypothetical protein [Gammaproteobacteria bacterium]
MHIPFIYILFIAEAMLVFIILSIVLGIVAYRLANSKKIPIDYADDQKNINIGRSYTQHLEIEMMKNTAQTKIENRIEHDTDKQPAAGTSKATKHSKLLQLRDLFLRAERSSADHADNDINFWNNVYSGMDNVLAHFKTIEHELTTRQDQGEHHAKDSAEKVFYIETQGKKVDGEVNRLKDIIYDRENTLSDLLKGLKHAEAEHKGTENEEFFTALHAQASNFERQLRDAKTCMDVLEMENTRLQDELHKLDAIKSGTGESSMDQISTVDAQSTRESIKKLEEEVIKKDVAYAKLQEEFASMEKEYLAMYNAIHGNNG